MNPVPLAIPCHRVVGSDGRLVGFSCEGGLKLKARLLASEGVGVHGNPGRVGEEFFLAARPGDGGGPLFFVP
jgi:alkylated DNA nucleotide flippase Atl1